MCQKDECGCENGGCESCACDGEDDRVSRFEAKLDQAEYMKMVVALGSAQKASPCVVQPHDASMVVIPEGIVFEFNIQDADGQLARCMLGVQDIDVDETKSIRRVKVAGYWVPVTVPLLSITKEE